MKSNILDGIKKSEITQIAEQYGFRHPHVIEQLLVDFAAYERVSKRLPCIIFGGMCMHLHSEGIVQRLSHDVDIMTTAAVDDVDKAMRDEFDPMQDCRASLASPRQPHPIKNLRTYHIHYESRLGGEGDVKMDFLCEFRCGLPTEVVHVPQVLGTKRPFKARVLTKEALLADKMTTLALGGIGLPERRLREVPKQVYDIATLIRMAGENEIGTALGMLDEAISSRINLHEDVKNITVTGTIASIQRSVESFLNFKSAAVMSRQYKQHLENFRSRYLQNGGEQYQKYERIDDLFTVMLFGANAGNVVSGAMSASEAASRVRKDMARSLAAPKEGDVEASNTRRRNLRDILSDKGVTKDFLFSLSKGQLTLLEAAHRDKSHQSM